MLQIAGNDNGKGGVNAQIVCTLQAGQTYYIRVKGADSGACSGFVYVCG